MTTNMSEFAPWQSTISCSITNRSKPKVILKSPSKVFHPKYSLSSHKLLIAHLSLFLLTKMPLWSHQDLQYLNSDSLSHTAGLLLVSIASCQIEARVHLSNRSVSGSRIPYIPWSSIHDNFLNVSPTVSFSKKSSIIGENYKTVTCKYIPNSSSLFLF